MRQHEIKHGTVNEYANFKCRCDLCKAAWRNYFTPKLRVYRAKKKAEAALTASASTFKESK